MNLGINRPFVYISNSPSVGYSAIHRWPAFKVVSNVNERTVLQKTEYYIFITFCLLNKFIPLPLKRGRLGYPFFQFLVQNHKTIQKKANNLYELMIELKYLVAKEMSY